MPLAQTRAFVQLIRRQESKEPWEETTGAADLRRWLYIGPKEQPLQAGDKVRAGGAAYVAQLRRPSMWERKIPLVGYSAAGKEGLV